MASAENKRRRKERRREDDSPWGSLMHKAPPGMEAGAFPGDDLAYAAEDDSPTQPAWRELWFKFNFWSLMATLLFIVFTGGLLMLVAEMWRPQDMRDIAGYSDKGVARDLALALKNAGGAEIVFTEGEINRYLRDTCRLRQTGVFSVIAHAQGVAVRIHDGYAELVIDRVLSAHLHQTTAVHLSFVQEFEHGRPRLRVDFRGGAPIMGSMPQGGSIGSVGVPQRHIQMLRPALETMADCYADLIDTVSTYGYRPEFYRGRNGHESFVRLIPHAPHSM